MKAIIELNIRKNHAARAGEPTEYISLYELWGKAGYKEPYNRWVRRILLKYDIKAQGLKIKSGKRGRNINGYYVSKNDFEVVKKAVEIRKKINIKYRKETDPNSQIEVFHNEERDMKIHAAIIDNKIWFVAKPLIKILADAKECILQTDKEDMIMIDSDYLGIEPRRKLRMVNESGLYDIVWHSGDKEARYLKNWLIDFVLPNMRRKL